MVKEYVNIILTQTEALTYTADAFGLSQIDFSKIESRPTSAPLLQYLRFQQSASTSVGINNGTAERELPRFQYFFYLVGFVSTNAMTVVYGLLCPFYLMEMNETNTVVKVPKQLVSLCIYILLHD